MTGEFSSSIGYAACLSVLFVFVATKLFDRVRAGRFADVVNTGGAERGLKNLSRALGTS